MSLLSVTEPEPEPEPMLCMLCRPRSAVLRPLCRFGKRLIDAPCAATAASLTAPFCWTMPPPLSLQTVLPAVLPLCLHLWADIVAAFAAAAASCCCCAAVVAAADRTSRCTASSALASSPGFLYCTLPCSGAIFCFAVAKSRGRPWCA